MSIMDEIYEGGGAKSIKWTDIGQTVEGTITALRSKQLTEFNTEIPEVWPSGEPKMTPIITIQTTLSDDSDDDGKRDIYLRAHRYTAFAEALREAYKVKPSDQAMVGATLKIRFDSTSATNKGSPRKLFRVRITPKSAVDDAWDNTENPAPQDDF